MQVPITIDETELVNGLTEPLAEAITESVLEAVLENENLRYAAQEAGSEAGSESGSESGWEAGREAAREEINDSDSGGLDWGSLRERMENEFTGRNYEGGCSEWRAYFGAMEHGMRESARLHEDGGYITGFLNEFRQGIIAEIQAGPGEGTDTPVLGAGASSLATTDLATTTNESLTKRVQELELLVAGLGQALHSAVGFDSASLSLSPLRTYAVTAEAHQWPAWMAGLVSNTTT